MKTILIDDEPLAIGRLKRLLGKYEDFEVIDEAKNGQEGLEKIEFHQPDVIFLDIEMPLMTGFLRSYLFPTEFLFAPWLNQIPPAA